MKGIGFLGRAVVCAAAGLGLLTALVGPLLFTADNVPAKESYEDIDWNHLNSEFVVTFRSGATPTDQWGTPRDRVQGYLRKPKGVGPFPAVVLLNGYRGVYEFERRWVERLADWGYVALLVNSNKRDFEPTIETSAADAWGALLYLKSEPEVDAGRVAVMGWAQGGGGMLFALASTTDAPARPGKDLAGDLQLRFRAGVGIYPLCVGAPRDYYAPALMLVGSEDTIDPPSVCKEAIARARMGREGLKLHVLPGVTHFFDVGKTLERGPSEELQRYDPKAEADTIARVRVFLAEALR